MNSAALAEDLIQRAWLPPTVAGLLALSRGGSGAWNAVRRDPGAVLLLLRLPALRRIAPDRACLAEFVQSPDVLEAAAAYLRAEGESSLTDWADSRRASIHTFSLRCAQAAHRLAVLTKACDPECAWVSGLLAPLGWLSVAAHVPDEAVASLADAEWGADPAQAERRRWGLDQAELARRLARQWQLPDWLTSILGHLGLPADVAVLFGADAQLFQITQLAVCLAQQDKRGVRLAVGGTAGELLRALGLPAVPELAEAEFAPPGAALTLTEFLTVEAARRRLSEQEARQQLEAELDVLHRTLEEQRGREEGRLLQKKLQAMAEFAAGAGHEINNPLAVISGQAQYLLGHEADPGRRASLEKIIGQTLRIHSLLRDLMQFARPAVPVLRSTDLVRLIDEVATSLADSAQQHRVRVAVRDEEGTHPPAAPPPCAIEADEKQVKAVLTNLLKNAIEAAGPEGWVRVRLEVTVDRAEVSIEDSGPGLSEAHREHLFDPFYSGRQAGRGRGLGLPTAWSLARQQGGSVSLASQPGEPTRFILCLPLPLERARILAG